jgi:hypothetical protein
MKERHSILLKLILLHLVLPIGLTIAAICTNQNYILTFLIAQTVIIIIFLSGYWEFFGQKFKLLYIIFLELLLTGQFIYKILVLSKQDFNPVFISVLSAIEVFLVIQLVRIFIVIYRRDSLSFEILFPLKNGNFLITDGGNSAISRLMNYHYYSPMHKMHKTNKSMLYATDIIKLDDKYPSFLPKENCNYPVFNEPVYSPIGGTVFKVENLIPDNEPFSGNYPYNTGNTVVIKKDDMFLLIGHLKQNSIVVKAGDIIAAGQMIASAGNSGMSERPHIHMQLIKSLTENFWQGIGVCITFTNKNLFKNRIIRA